MEAEATFAQAVFDRTPPYSLEAETAVLGGMLIDREAVTRAVEHLDEGMFYREANRRLYRAMIRLFERGGVIDVITLSEELKNTGELESAGGFDYLAALVDAVPTAANIAFHARIVRDKALLRRLVEQSSQIIRDVYEQGERDVNEILDQAEARIFRLRRATSARASSGSRRSSGPRSSTSSGCRSPRPASRAYRPVCRTSIDSRPVSRRGTSASWLRGRRWERRRWR